MANNNSNKYPQFYCDCYHNNGLHNNCFDSHNSSYLKQNQLKCLLEKNNDYCNYWSHKEVIDLFETNFKLSSNDLTTKQLTILFTFVKKYINELRSGSMTRSGCHRNVYKYNYCKVRTQICSFLTFLKRQLFIICFESNDHNINDHLITSFIMKELKSLLLFIGRLSQLEPQIVRLSICSEPETAIYNYFHSCLDIWWTAIELTYIVSQNNSINLSDFNLVKEEIPHNLCSQTIKLVLYDLIALSLNRFNEITIVHEYLTLSPFMCSCIKEMFIMIKHIISAINTDDSNHKFYEQIFSVLNLFINSTNSLSITDFKTISIANCVVKRPSFHFLWFTTNIATVFTYDISGQFSDKLNAGLIPSALLKLLTQALKENDVSVNESELSCIILFCLKTTKYWRPNTDLLLPFTEFFLKKLNHRFMISNSVEDLGVIPKSSAKWIAMIRDISSLNDYSHRIESSFKLYLSLVSAQLSQIFKYCDSKSKALNWQKFKGKVIVNLQPKKLEKIDEIGVFNLFSFYLILINSSEELWSEIIDKILDVMNELLKQNNSKHFELILKFTFTSLQIKPNSISDTKITYFIAKQFNNICEERMRNSGSILLNKSFPNIIIIYFEELQSIVKSNQFSKVPFDKLLNIKFSAFSVSYISINEQSFVLNFINYLLTYINQTLETQSYEIETHLFIVIKACFETILPFVKQEISSKNCNNAFIEIAFNFTILTNMMKESNSTQFEKFSILFVDFLTLSRNNPEFTSNYLSLILENQKAIENLKKESQNISSNLIAIWCRLIVSQEVSEGLINSLSSNLSLIIDDLRFDETLDFSSTSLDVFISFLRNLTKKFSESTINEQMRLIQDAHKYFNDMILTSESILKRNNVSHSVINRIYLFVSNLVSIASQLLYIPSKPDCLLPKIIDSIILPTHLHNSQNNHHLSQIFQRNFPAFFEGFCKLSYNGSQYLERQIRRMISFYLLSLVNRSNIYFNLKSTFVKLNIYNHWCKLLLETISKNFLSKTEINITPALIEYLCDFCKYDLSQEDLVIVLDHALDKVLLTDNSSKDSLFLLIKTIIEKIANSSQQQNHKVLIDRVFNSFIEKNLSNKSYLKRFFEVLNFVSNCCPQMFHDLIGEITRNIESIEKKRNIGNDFILRKALRDFANKTSI